jgi:pyruvate/2-oxoglutarate dehydrogenase complex dihydrolipoamide dehydrogenase (E3) component
MALAWRSLGAHVTLVEGCERLLPREEPFAGEQVGEALAEQGIELYLEALAERVERRDGHVRVSLDDGRTLDGTQLAVALGRRPVTDESGSTTWAWSQGTRSTSTSTCACRTCRGCTRSAT